jgi:hypothetical protein
VFIEISAQTYISIYIVFFLKSREQRAGLMPEAISSSPLEMAPKLTGIQGLFTCLRFAKKKLIEMLVDPTKASEKWL